jgi:ribosome-binding protein aMBF1 (putative translation factor)
MVDEAEMVDLKRCFVCGRRLDGVVRKVRSLGSGLYICTLCDGNGGLDGSV